MLRERSLLEKSGFVLEIVAWIAHCVLYKATWARDTLDKTRLEFTERCFQPFPEKQMDCAQFDDIFQTNPPEIVTFKVLVLLGHCLSAVGVIVSLLGMQTFSILYQPIKRESDSKVTKRHILFVSSQLLLVSGILMGGAVGIYKYSILDQIDTLRVRYIEKPGITFLSDKITGIDMQRDTGYWLAVAVVFGYVFAGMSLFFASIKIYDESDNVRKVLLKKRATLKNNGKFKPDEWQWNGNLDQLIVVMSALVLGFIWIGFSRDEWLIEGKVTIGERFEKKNVLQSIQFTPVPEGDKTEQKICAILSGTMAAIAYALLIFAMDSFNYDFDNMGKKIIPNRPGFFMRWISVSTRAYIGAFFSLLTCITCLATFLVSYVKTEKPADGTFDHLGTSSILFILSTIISLAICIGSCILQHRQSASMVTPYILQRIQVPLSPVEHQSEVPIPEYSARTAMELTELGGDANTMLADNTGYVQRQSAVRKLATPANEIEHTGYVGLSGPNVVTKPQRSDSELPVFDNDGQAELNAPMEIYEEHPSVLERPSDSGPMNSTQIGQPYHTFPSVSSVPHYSTPPSVTEPPGTELVERANPSYQSQVTYQPVPLNRPIALSAIDIDLGNSNGLSEVENTQYKVNEVANESYQSGQQCEQIELENPIYAKQCTTDPGHGELMNPSYQS